MPVRYRRLLRNRDFLLLTGGQTVSRMGDGLQVAALLWLALNLGGTRAVSLAALASSLPVLLLGLLGGVYVDRWDRRRTLIASNLLRGLAVLIVPAAAALGGLQAWHLLLTAGLLSAFGALAEPASWALLPALVERDDLTAGNALLGASLQASFWLGPALLVVMLRVAALKDVFTIDAATFALAALAVVLLRERVGKQPVVRTSVRTELVQGFASVRRDLLLWLPLAVFGIGILFAAGAREVALPVLVKSDLHRGAAAFGLMIGAAGVGELLGNLLVGALTVRRKGAASCFGWGLLGLFRAFLGVVPSWQAGAGLLFCTGALSGLTDAPLVALLQERTPERQIGRVISLWRTITYGAFVLAPPLVAGLLALLPVGAVFFLCGMITCAIGLAGAAVCARREAALPVDRAAVAG